MKHPAFYTLGTAAKALGVTKTTVKNWIDSRELSYTKNDKGHFQIQRVDLERLYPDKLRAVELEQSIDRPQDAKNGHHKTPEIDPALQAVIDLNKALVEQLEKRIEEKDNSLTDLKARLDQSNNILEDQRTEAEKAAKKLVDIELAAPVIKPRKVTFMDWLRGRELAEVEEVA